VAKGDRNAEGEALSGLSHRIDRRFEVTLQAFESNIELNKGIAASLMALTDSINEHRREFVKHDREFAEQRREYREETRAHREALFRLLDRLDEGGGPAPAT